MQIICTSLQTDNHASTSPLGFYRLDALHAAQPIQRQSTEDNRRHQTLPSDCNLLSLYMRIKHNVALWWIHNDCVFVDDCIIIPVLALHCIGQTINMTCSELSCSIFLLHVYFVPARSTKYCNEHVCLFLCLSACISQKPYVQTSQNFLHLTCGWRAMAWSSADDTGTLYVLQIHDLRLRFMLNAWLHVHIINFHMIIIIMVHMVCGVSIIDVGTALKQVVHIFSVFTNHQRVPCCLILI